MTRIQEGFQRGWDKLLAFRPGPWALGLAGLVIFGLMCTRRYDLIRHPQFWAEEGLFFAEATKASSWLHLTRYYAGYFDLFLRLLNELACTVPLVQAPFVLIFSAFLLQTFFGVFVLSERLAPVVGPFPFRLLLVLLLAGLPNAQEYYGVALHSRLFLALWAVLILVLENPDSKTGRWAESGVLLVSALSGPFVFVLTGVAAVDWIFRRRTRTREHLCLLALPVLAAAYVLLAFPGQRDLPIGLGATPMNLVRLCGGQVVTGFFVGTQGYSTLLQSAWFDPVVLVAFGLLLVWSWGVLRKGTAPERLLWLYGVGLLAAGLATPLASITIPQWEALWKTAGCGQRYYFHMMTACAIILVSETARSTGWARSGRLLLLALVFLDGVRLDWRIPAFVDFHWARYVREYQKIPPGEEFEIPINPPGWKMVLKKPFPPSDAP